MMMGNATHTAAPLLQVKHLQTHFFTDAGVVKAVEDVSFALNTGETLAVVGESGSGKSVTSLSIMGLIPNPPGRIVGGEILFRTREGLVVDLAKLPVKALRKLRGRDIAMIFQEPMTSLDPVFTVGDQIAETAALHLGMNRAAAMRRALEMLELVEIPAAKQRLNEYPHQLSGGMRQRVMIALALSCNPSLLIADEPTTALDVTIQAQILDLLREMKSAFNLSLLLITHDLGIIAETADRVAVMYTGRLVEEGSVRAILRDPKHPYTRGLLASIPGGAPGERLRAIEGSVPMLGALPPGCAFNPRCPDRFDRCTTAPPPEYDVGPEHGARCYLHDPSASARGDAQRASVDTSARRGPQRAWADRER